MKEGKNSRRTGRAAGIRPDVMADFGIGVIRERIILDTKWKAPKDGVPADDDLKQLYAYNLHFGGRRGVLVYPRADTEQNGTCQPYARSTGLPFNHTHECATYYVDLFDDHQKPRRDIGAKLIERVILDA